MTREYDDEEEEQADDFFVHLAKQMWRGFCAPFRAIGAWQVKSQARSKQANAAEAARLAARRQAAAQRKEAAPQFMMLRFLAHMNILVGALTLVVAVALLIAKLS